MRVSELHVLRVRDVAPGLGTQLVIGIAGHHARLVVELDELLRAGRDDRHADERLVEEVVDQLVGARLPRLQAQLLHAFLPPQQHEEHGHDGQDGCQHDERDPEHRLPVELGNLQAGAKNGQHQNDEREAQESGVEKNPSGNTAVLVPMQRGPHSAGSAAFVPVHAHGHFSMPKCRAIASNSQQLVRKASAISGSNRRPRSSAMMLRTDANGNASL